VPTANYFLCPVTSVGRFIGCESLVTPERMVRAHTTLVPNVKFVPRLRVRLCTRTSRREVEVLPSLY